eukprot:COSAG02_NODE_36137_length_459_cov_1.125348_1_plen_90_part_00
MNVVLLPLHTHVSKTAMQLAPPSVRHLPRKQGLRFAPREVQVRNCLAANHLVQGDQQVVTLVGGNGGPTICPCTAQLEAVWVCGCGQYL